MIGQLRGKLIEKQPPYLMIDVNGVGYSCQAPLSTFFSLPEIGQEVTLKTHLIVREDAHILYAFANQQECRLFQEVIKVSGIGPKIALTILSGLSVQEFSEILSTQDVARLQRLPGIGGKTAQRMIVEMQDKFAKLNLSMTSPLKRNDASHEAIAALVALGYKPQEASKAINKLPQQEMSVEQLIKEALQGLAKI